MLGAEGLNSLAFANSLVLNCVVRVMHGWGSGGKHVEWGRPGRRRRDCDWQSAGAFAALAFA
eukprot:6039259-Alexandrium_andersonii.AAC.1